MGLAKDDLDPNSSPLYGFIGDHVISKRVAKLTVIVEAHPQTSIVLANFLVVNALSAINRIIGRPLLKALKEATSIYHLTMKSQWLREHARYEATNIIQGNATTSLSG